MDRAAGDGNDDKTNVIFSLSVSSEEPIPAFAEVLRHRKPGGSGYFYDFGTTQFDEDDWSVRADKLETAVITAVDSLEATGVDPSELARDDVLVRAFFTFGPGAETLSASLVQRLARVQATIWIDA